MRQPYTGQRLETSLRTELTLHLTPLMQLRLNILQANILSLEEIVALEIEQNPALEIAEPESEKASETGKDSAETEGEEEKSEESVEEREFTVDDFYPSDMPFERTSRDEMPEPGSPIADRSSLEEHLMRQIVNIFGENENNYEIALFILDNLDVDGFLHLETEKIAEIIDVEEDKVIKVRSRIQRMDPLGIASNSIQEALVIQLLDAGYDEKSPEIRILTEGFDMLLQKRITSLSNRLKIPLEKVTRAFERIAELDPKPGRNFRVIACRTVQPDIALRYRENRLEVFINESPLPPLRLSARVRQILENPKRFTKDEVEFARKKLEAAQFFIKGILQRRDTLTRLARELLNRNYDYFSGRSKQISRLRMKDVADALGLHSSTISRATKDKYLETPVGIFPLRSFFAKGEKNPIMTKLEQIIAAEDKSSPLTDAAIAERLKLLGMKISRRTVAKYRLKLNIPDCFQRKALAH